MLPGSTLVEMTLLYTKILVFVAKTVLATFQSKTVLNVAFHVQT